MRRKEREQEGNQKPCDQYYPKQQVSYSFFKLTKPKNQCDRHHYQGKQRKVQPALPDIFDHLKENKSRDHKQQRKRDKNKKRLNDFIGGEIGSLPVENSKDYIQYCSKNTAHNSS